MISVLHLCDCAHVFVIVCGILYITRLAFHSKDLFNSFIKIKRKKGYIVTTMLVKSPLDILNLKKATHEVYFIIDI